MLLMVRIIEDGMGRWRTALRLVGVGWYVGICIILGILSGHWLDNKLDTNLLWIVGLISGIVVAFYGVYRMLLPFTGNKSKEYKERK